MTSYKMFADTIDILKVRTGSQAWYQIRCDYTALLNFLDTQRKAAARYLNSSRGIQIDFWSKDDTAFGQG